MTQRFLMAAYGAALRFPGPVAIVAQEQLLDPERFGVMVARAHGANLQVFTDLDEAERWLTAGARLASGAA